MNSNPPNNNHERDEEFVAELQRFALRPPPAAWRAEILSAAGKPALVPLRWYRSPFWSSMAALWAVLLTLWLDTQRLTPDSASQSAGASPAAAPLTHEELQALLASLDGPAPHHHALRLP